MGIFAIFLSSACTLIPEITGWTLDKAVSIASGSGQCAFGIVETF